jgi:hypothetical protein
MDAASPCAERACGEMREKVVTTGAFGTTFRTHLQGLNDGVDEVITAPPLCDILWPYV